MAGAIIPAMHSKPKLGVGMVLMAATLWGTTGTARAIGAGELSSYWFGALRLFVASVFFAVCAAAFQRGRTLCARRRLSSVDVFGAGLCMAVYNLAFFAGIRDIGVAIGTAIALGSGPIWAGILQSIVDRRSPTIDWWAGMLVAVTGGVLLTRGGAGTEVEIGILGVSSCLLSGFSYAVYTLFNKRMADVAPAATITLYAFSIAALLAVPAAFLASGVPVLRAGDAAGIAYTGVVTAGVAYLLFSHALRHISTATGVTLALGEPVVAFALAVLLLDEHADVAALVGLVCVLVGVVVVVRQELRGEANRRVEARSLAPASGSSR